MFRNTELPVLNSCGCLALFVSAVVMSRDTFSASVSCCRISILFILVAKLTAMASPHGRREAAFVGCRLIASNGGMPIIGELT